MLTAKHATQTQKIKKENKTSWNPFVLLETKTNENFIVQNALAYL